MINHTITVRNRRIKVDTPRLIQGCTGSDSIILDLDDEWTGLDEIHVSIGSGDSRQDAVWDGEPMVIEHIDFPIGYLPVSVTGLYGAEPERLLRLPAELLSVLRLLSHGKRV